MRVIGGMQKHQTVRDDGICPTLTASMGCGGGYVPIVLWYDFYNNKVHKEGVIGTLATHPQDGHSGTFWVITNERCEDNTIGQLCQPKGEQSEEPKYLPTV